MSSASTTAHGQRSSTTERWRVIEEQMHVQVADSNIETTGATGPWW
jgi:hypothetical protein